MVRTLLPTIGAIALLLGGCASASAPRDSAPGPGAARPSPSEAVPQGQWALPVWPGTTLLLGQDGAAGLRVPSVTGSRGEALAASLWHVQVEPGVPTWIGVESRWRAVRVEARQEPPAAGDLLLLAVEIPADFFGEEIVVGGRRVRVVVSPALIDAAWVSPLPVYADFGPILRASMADETNPMLRWRSRLVRSGVPSDPTLEPVELEGDLLEALAVQEELRWRAGLSRLYEASPDLCAGVRDRLLCRVESQEAGLAVPLWTQDLRPLEQLKGILLDDRASDAALVSRTQAWLRRQPDGVAWIEDVFAHSQPEAALGFVRAWAGNASDRPALAWIEFRGDRPPGVMASEPRVLQPGELSLIEAAVRPTLARSQAVAVEVHVGGRLERGEVVLGTPPAEPPGLRLGPLLTAHDAASLLTGEQFTGDQSSCAGFLRRLDATGPAPSDVAARSRWSILLEVSGGEPVEPGVITLEFVHAGGRTQISVNAEGRVTVSTPTGLPRSGYPDSVPMVRVPGRWAAEVPIPDWCVGLDGRLHVQLVRRGMGEAMWSWPSRVLRLAPGRGGHAVVDLGAWDRGAAEPGG